MEKGDLWPTSHWNLRIDWVWILQEWLCLPSQNRRMPENEVYPLYCWVCHSYSSVLFFASINLCNITNIARLPSHMKSVLEEITRLTAECHQRLVFWSKCNSITRRKFSQQTTDKTTFNRAPARLCTASSGRERNGKKTRQQHDQTSFFLSCVSSISATCRASSRNM